MEALYFCRDGILRRSFSGYDADARKHHMRKVPMQVYEACIDPSAFAKSLHSYVVFEAGLTVEEMMENLSPWADFMTGVACMDFPAFLKEIRNDPQEKLDEVVKITLNYACSITAMPKYDRSKIKKEKGIFRLGDPVVTDRLQIEEGWTMNAHLAETAQDKYDGSKTVSLSFSPMSDWKHLEIAFEMDGVLSDMTPSRSSKGFLTAKMPLTSNDHPMVEEVIAHHGEVFQHKIPLQAPSPTFFDALIRGFFWYVGFHYSPVQRDKTMEDLKVQIAEIDTSDENIFTEVVEAGDNIFSAEGVAEDEPEADAEEVSKFEMFKIDLNKMEELASELGLPIEKPATIH